MALFHATFFQFVYTGVLYFWLCFFPALGLLSTEKAGTMVEFIT